MSGARRFWISSAVGLVSGVLAWLLSHRWPLGLLVLVLITAAAYVAWSLSMLLPMDAERTRAHANEADVDDELGNFAFLVVMAGSLSAIGILLMSGSDRNRAAYAGLAIVAVLSVWAMIHTMYMARYARLYYQGSQGIDFNSEAPPRYADFCYFSFNLGMTYQVSDTAVSDSAIRGDVLKHCLFSYVYGTILIACTINLVLNLVGS